MVMHPRLPEGSGPDEAQRSDVAPTYSVGYGRPPVDTRFKPGHSKRGGRPKGRRNIRSVFEEMLNERITLREGTRTRSLSKRDALHLRMINDALAGNEKAQAKVLALMQLHRLNEEPQEATNRKSFTADDEAVIADFLQRHSGGAPMQQVLSNPTAQDESPTKDIKDPNP